ncbi:hypothetical protein IH779_02405 [Patescibacteria group bacterium]|nr:hypothetical protein [Patescibacteria group bacterium]
MKKEGKKELDSTFDDSMFEEEEEIEKKKPDPIWKTLLITSVVLMVIGGLIWLSGGYQAFLYRKTPPIKEKEFQSILEAEKIVVPLNIIVFQNEGNLGSQRDKANIRQLIDNASRIWAQADITLSIQAIHSIVATDDTISRFFRTPNLLARDIPQFELTVFNLFLVGNLGGINGIAFGGINSLAVADYTTVHDFRVTAHEIGHLLSLSHTEEVRNRLMFRGANGTKLTEGEVIAAYTTALEFFGE